MNNETDQHKIRVLPRADRGSVERIQAYNACIRGLAGDFGCILADVWNAEGGADWLIHPDGVHANRVGNLVIAHRVFEAIAQNASALTVVAFEQLQSTEWTRNTTQQRLHDNDPFIKT